MNSGKFCVQKRVFSEPIPRDRKNLAHCAIYLSWRSCWFHLIRFARHTVLTSPNKDETAVHGYGPTFIGSVIVLVSRKAISFNIVSALHLCCMSVHFFG